MCVYTERLLVGHLVGWWHGLCGLLGSLAWVALAVARAGALVGPAWKLVRDYWAWVFAMCDRVCIMGCGA